MKPDSRALIVTTQALNLIAACAVLYIFWVGGWW
jgi:hypothetical protein